VFNTELFFAVGKVNREPESVLKKAVPVLCSTVQAAEFVRMPKKNSTKTTASPSK